MASSCKKVIISLKRQHKAQPGSQTKVKAKDAKVVKIFDNSDDDEDEGETAQVAQPFVAIAKLPLLEDGAALFRRLRSEGEVLAEAEKFWQSIKVFDRALQVEAIKEQQEQQDSAWIEGETRSTVNKRGGGPVGKHEVAEVLDMKAQALMQVYSS